MKAFADLQRRQLSSEAPLAGQDFEYQLASAKPSRGRLQAVSAFPAAPLAVEETEPYDREALGIVPRVATNLVIRPDFNYKSKLRKVTAPKLTTEEFIQVRLATVRESTRHCYWPADVVATFAAAEVIR
jgi:hypothetical protein